MFSRFNHIGFSTIEVLVVICIVSILNAIAIKQYQIYRSQAQIEKAVASVHAVRLDIAEYYMYYGKWPASSSELRDSAVSVLDADSSEYHMALENGGAINILFKNLYAVPIENPVLTIRPVLSRGDGPGYMAWLCGNAAVPGDSVVWAQNQSNIPGIFLPYGCR